MEAKEKTLGSWDGFLGGGSFLTAEDVPDENTPFNILGTEITDDGKVRTVLAKVGDSETNYLFDLNVTNSNFLSEAGITAPLMLKDKRIYFRKVAVMSPKTKKEVIEFKKMINEIMTELQKQK